MYLYEHSRWLHLLLLKYYAGFEYLRKIKMKQNNSKRGLFLVQPNIQVLVDYILSSQLTVISSQRM